MTNTLVVVPCGRRKIWDAHPRLGGAPARDVYVGPSFRINRQYGERFADTWVILSAKHGFVAPNHIIPGPYDVTFKDARTNPITVELLREQMRSEALDDFDTVVALGGKDYRSIVEAAFLPTGATVTAPFAGLPIGKYMQAVKRATVSGQPFPGAPPNE
jgi:hypothetical protein